MKVVNLHTSETKLIKQAQQYDYAAQEAIYKTYAGKMLSVCRYYIKDIQYAEDVMIMGFTKAFKHIEGFEFKGSFEGWLKKIMIREAITFLRSRKELVFTDDVSVFETATVTTESYIDAEQIQLLIDQLPNGYKTVFLLYAIEGYSHQEIAEMLQINKNTSKSQLHKARKMLQEQLEVLTKNENGTQ